MVCLPCVAIPILLLIWRFIIQPIIMKFKGMLMSGTNEDGEKVELVKDCKDGKCALSWRKTESQSTAASGEEAADKKTD